MPGNEHDNLCMTEKLLTVQEVADLLQVPKSWVYERTRTKGIEQLPHLKLGKYLRFEARTVREFLERQAIGIKGNA